MTCSNFESDDYAKEDRSTVLLAHSVFLPVFSTQKGQVSKRLRTKCRNIDKYFTAADMHFTRMYFDENPVYSDKIFEQCFRMPYALFGRIRDNMTSCSLFTYRKGATGTVGISPRMRIVAALRILSYEKQFD